MGQRFDQQGTKATINPKVDVILNLDMEDIVGGIPDIKQSPFSLLLSEGPNMVVVNLDCGGTVTGNKFQTLTEAINYIVSKGCSPSTPWSIMIEGDYNPEAEEIISLPRGCTIKGTITNVIGANVTIDPPYISVLSENPTAVLLTTGFATITFRGKLSISFKGLDPDPLGGGVTPYMTGMGISLVTFSPHEISGTGVATMLFNSIYCSILQGDYSGFVFNRHMFNNIASIDGDIIFDGFQLFNSQILCSDNVGSTYGITFLNTGTSGIDYFASNCYFQMFKPATTQTKIIDGKGQFWNCSMELAWDGIKASRLYFKNCLIYGTKKIGGVEDDNTLQVNSNGTLSILGGHLNVNDDGKIEMLADTGETSYLEIKGVTTDNNMGYNIDVYKTGDGTVEMNLTDISVPFLDIDASVDTVSRYGCLWDNAPDTDENNFYSAKKIHELIV